MIWPRSIFARETCAFVCGAGSRSLVLNRLQFHPRRPRLPLLQAGVYDQTALARQFIAVLPAIEFRELVRPLHDFTHGPQGVEEECPF